LLGDRVIPAALDVTDAAQVEGLAARVGALDLLVNNAAALSPWGETAAGRIVNVSSGAGSHGDPAFGLHTGNAMGTSYAVAKAALNALTVKLAREETAATLRINAVCPGFTATFEGGAAMGARPVAEGAASILWAADIGNDGPTGGLFRDGIRLAW
jgi:NAD(P)-dependent dehydrogenase (short-subunit alcohol dehydrogenase family)